LSIVGVIFDGHIAFMGIYYPAVRSNVVKWIFGFDLWELIISLGNLATTSIKSRVSYESMGLG